MSSTAEQVSPSATATDSDESSFSGVGLDSEFSSSGGEKPEPKKSSTPSKKSSIKKVPRSAHALKPAKHPGTEVKSPASVAIKSPPTAVDQSSQPRKRKQNKTRLDDRPYNLALPHSTETTLLIQLDDQASSLLEGATGAIGRIEASSERVVLDLQGQQYIGTLLPGPTALLLGRHSEENTLKIEGITNDFLRTDTVQSNGDMKNPLDFLHHEENVNRKNPDEAKAQGRPKKQVKRR